MWKPPAGLGGSRATFGATFDGEPIVAARTVPIAADGWNAGYPSHATGSGCAVARAGTGTGTGTGTWGSVVAILMVAAAVRRQKSGHSDARVTSQPWGSQTSSSGSKR